ncbi:MAG: GFA family protein [Polyangiaceae bacterium]
MKSYDGGCHCGAVRFRARLEDDQEVIDCNCSMCAKKGIVHFIVPEDRFEILKGRDALAVYTFGTHVAKHMFCKTCGIHAFYRPRSHPDRWDVNARCLDDDAWKTRRVVKFDGQKWEENVEQIRKKMK